MACIHYKFKSNLEYDKIDVEGLQISLLEFKRLLFDKHKISREAFDFTVINAQTKEEYSNEIEGRQFILRNTSVIVQRIPAVVQVKLPKVWDTRNEGSVKRGNTFSSNVGPSLDAGKDEDLPEDERLSKIMSESTAAYDPKQYKKSGVMKGKPAPAYTCNKCNQMGHWITDCPSADLKRSTGIPRHELMDTTADNPQAMITDQGQFVVPIIHNEARLKGKIERPVFMDEDNPEPAVKPEPLPKKEVPDDLICPVCQEILRDAVVIQCCGSSFCDECIRTKLLESEMHECPSCQETGQSPDKLVRNEVLRKMVFNFLNDSSGAKNRTPVVPQRTMAGQFAHHSFGGSGGPPRHTAAQPRILQPPPNVLALIQSPSKLQTLEQLNKGRPSVKVEPISHIGMTLPTVRAIPSVAAQDYPAPRHGYAAGLSASSSGGPPTSAQNQQHLVYTHGGAERLSLVGHINPQQAAMVAQTSRPPPPVGSHLAAGSAGALSQQGAPPSAIATTSGHVSGDLGATALGERNEESSSESIGDAPVSQSGTSTSGSDTVPPAAVTSSLATSAAMMPRGFGQGSGGGLNRMPTAQPRIPAPLLPPGVSTPPQIAVVPPMHRPPPTIPPTGHNIAAQQQVVPPQGAIGGVLPLPTTLITSGQPLPPGMLEAHPNEGPVSVPPPAGVAAPSASSVPTPVEAQAQPTTLLSRLVLEDDPLTEFERHLARQDQKDKERRQRQQQAKPSDAADSVGSRNLAIGSASGKDKSRKHSQTRSQTRSQTPSSQSSGDSRSGDESGSYESSVSGSETDRSSDSESGSDKSFGVTGRDDAGGQLRRHRSRSPTGRYDTATKGSTRPSVSVSAKTARQRYHKHGRGDSESSGSEGATRSRSRSQSSGRHNRHRPDSHDSRHKRVVAKKSQAHSSSYSRRGERSGSRGRSSRGDAGGGAGSSRQHRSSASPSTHHRPPTDGRHGDPKNRYRRSSKDDAYSHQKRRTYYATGSSNSGYRRKSVSPRRHGGGASSSTHPYRSRDFSPTRNHLRGPVPEVGSSRLPPSYRRRRSRSPPITGGPPPAVFPHSTEPTSGPPGLIHHSTQSTFFAHDITHPMSASGNVYPITFSIPPFAAHPGAHLQPPHIPAYGMPQPGAVPQTTMYGRNDSRVGDRGMRHGHMGRYAGRPGENASVGRYSAVPTVPTRHHGRTGRSRSLSFEQSRSRSYSRYDEDDDVNDTTSHYRDKPTTTERGKVKERMEPPGSSSLAHRRGASTAESPPVIAKKAKHGRKRSPSGAEMSADSTAGPFSPKHHKKHKRHTTGSSPGPGAQKGSTTSDGAAHDRVSKKKSGSKKHGNKSLVSDAKSEPATAEDTPATPQFGATLACPPIPTGNNPDSQFHTQTPNLVGAPIPILQTVSRSLSRDDSKVYSQRPDPQSYSRHITTVPLSNRVSDYSNNNSKFDGQTRNLLTIQPVEHYDVNQSTNVETTNIAIVGNAEVNNFNHNPEPSSHLGRLENDDKSEHHDDESARLNDTMDDVTSGGAAEDESSSADEEIVKLRKASEAMPPSSAPSLSKEHILAMLTGRGPKNIRKTSAPSFTADNPSETSKAVILGVGGDCITKSSSVDNIPATEKLRSLMDTSVSTDNGCLGHLNLENKFSDDLNLKELSNDGNDQAASDVVVADHDDVVKESNEKRLNLQESVPPPSDAAPSKNSPQLLSMETPIIGKTVIAETTDAPKGAPSSVDNDALDSKPSTETAIPIQDHSKLPSGFKDVDRSMESAADTVSSMDEGLEKTRDKTSKKTKKDKKRKHKKHKTVSSEPFLDDQKEKSIDAKLEKSPAVIPATNAELKASLDIKSRKVAESSCSRVLVPKGVPRSDFDKPEISPKRSSKSVSRASVETVRRVIEKDPVAPLASTLPPTSAAMPVADDEPNSSTAVHVRGQQPFPRSRPPPTIQQLLSKTDFPNLSNLKKSHATRKIQSKGDHSFSITVPAGALTCTVVAREETSIPRVGSARALSTSSLTKLGRDFDGASKPSHRDSSAKLDIVVGDPFSENIKPARESDEDEALWMEQWRRKKDEETKMKGPTKPLNETSPLPNAVSRTVKLSSASKLSRQLEFNQSESIELDNRMLAKHDQEAASDPVERVRKKKSKIRTGGFSATVTLNSAQDDWPQSAAGVDVRDRFVPLPGDSSTAESFISDHSYDDYQQLGDELAESGSARNLKKKQKKKQKKTKHKKAALGVPVEDVARDSQGARDETEAEAGQTVVVKKSKKKKKHAASDNLNSDKLENKSNADEKFDFLEPDCVEKIETKVLTIVSENNDEFEPGVIKSENLTNQEDSSLIAKTAIKSSAECETGKIVNSEDKIDLTASKNDEKSKSSIQTNEVDKTVAKEPIRREKTSSTVDHHMTKSHKSSYNRRHKHSGSREASKSITRRQGASKSTDRRHDHRRRSASRSSSHDRSRGGRDSRNSHNQTSHSNRSRSPHSRKTRKSPSAERRISNASPSGRDRERRRRDRDRKRSRTPSRRRSQRSDRKRRKSRSDYSVSPSRSRQSSTKKTVRSEKRANESAKSSPKVTNPASTESISRKNNRSPLADNKSTKVSPTKRSRTRSNSTGSVFESKDKKPSSRRESGSPLPPEKVAVPKSERRKLSRGKHGRKRSGSGPKKRKSSRRSSRSTSKRRDSSASSTKRKRSEKVATEVKSGELSSSDEPDTNCPLMPLIVETSMDGVDDTPTQQMGVLPAPLGGDGKQRIQKTNLIPVDFEAVKGANDVPPEAESQINDEATVSEKIEPTPPRLSTGPPTSSTKEVMPDKPKPMTASFVRTLEMNKSLRKEMLGEQNGSGSDGEKRAEESVGLDPAAPDGDDSVDLRDKVTESGDQHNLKSES